MVEATLIPPDSSGTEAIAITSRDTSGRYRIAEVIVRESVRRAARRRGVAQRLAAQGGPRRARTSNLGTAPVPVSAGVGAPPDRGREAAERGVGAGRAARVRGVSRFHRARAGGRAGHPVADLEESLTDEQVAARIARLRRRCTRSRSSGTGCPSRPALDELLQKVGQRLGSAGMRDPGQVNTALREEIELATDRFFSPEVRGQLATRMRSSAVSLRARKGRRGGHHRPRRGARHQGGGADHRRRRGRSPSWRPSSRRRSACSRSRAAGSCGSRSRPARPGPPRAPRPRAARSLPKARAPRPRAEGSGAEAQPSTGG